MEDAWRFALLGPHSNSLRTLDIKSARGIIGSYPTRINERIRNKAVISE